MVLEKILESPLDSKEIKLVNPKGNQPWIFIGGTVVEAKAPILWLPDVKSQLTGKDPDAGKDWRQEKGTTEDEMVGKHHQLNGHESEQIPGESEGQESLSCYSPWDCKDLDRTWQLNNNNWKMARKTSIPKSDRNDCFCRFSWSQGHLIHVPTVHDKNSQHSSCAKHYTMS